MQPASICYRNSSSFHPYSVAETRFSQDSALNYHSGPTEGATYTTVTNSHSEGSDVILLSLQQADQPSLSSMNLWCGRNDHYGPKYTAMLYILPNHVRLIHYSAKAISGYVRTIRPGSRI
ncbi:unnamed protein product [Hymenolepis diminuta]|uniref:Uncharacterized protein n=1 Tax=Hymenolepis diminuta TaxID=6216 RepID=A0A564ZBE8_HYMDI|nr:unnamed protein product [Hymenolepis diminuta]